MGRRYLVGANSHPHELVRRWNFANVGSGVVDEMTHLGSTQRTTISPVGSLASNRNVAMAMPPAAATDEITSAPKISGGRSCHRSGRGSETRFRASSLSM